MNRNYLKPIASLIIFTLFFAQTMCAQKNDETAIRQLLTRQANDWNHGNIEAFMHGYWYSDSLLFIGKNGVRNGYATTLESYKKGYPDTTAMGKLHFDFIQLRRLSPVYYFMVGTWHLKRTIGDLQGHFTLLLKKLKGKWVIIADHSS